MHPLVLLLIGVTGYIVYRGTKKKPETTTSQSWWVTLVDDIRPGSEMDARPYSSYQLAKGYAQDAMLVRTTDNTDAKTLDRIKWTHIRIDGPSPFVTEVIR